MLFGAGIMQKRTTSSQEYPTNYAMGNVFIFPSSEIPGTRYWYATTAYVLHEEARIPAAAIISTADRGFNQGAEHDGISGYLVPGTWY